MGGMLARTPGKLIPLLTPAKVSRGMALETNNHLIHSRGLIGVLKARPLDSFRTRHSHMLLVMVLTKFVIPPLLSAMSWLIPDIVELVYQPRGHYPTRRSR